MRVNWWNRYSKICSGGTWEHQFASGGFMVMLKAVSASRWKNETAVILSSCIFFCAVPSFSAVPDPDDYAEADELLLFQDMTLVVSASRQKQPANLLSVPVTVLTADDLHYGGHNSIDEALRYAPGVDVVQMDRNRYGIGIRGLEGSFSDRMMTLIDGMPIDSPAFGGAEFSSLPIVMEDIARIEIVRGSGGAAWGANALSGVINIITKDPDTVPGLFVSSSVSEYGDSTSQMRFAGSSGNWDWLISAAHEEMKSSADVLDLAPDEGGDDSLRRTLARGEFVYGNDSDLKVTFGAGMTGSERGAFEIVDAAVTGKDNDLNTANGHVRIEKKFDAETSAYLRWAGRYQDMDRPSYGSVKYRVEEHDIEAQVDMTGVSGHSLAFGGNFKTTAIYSHPVQPDVFTLVEENIYENWLGIFGSDRYQYSSQLFFEAQLRGDYYSEGDFDWSGRLSSIYGIDAALNHVVRLSVAKSYRQPVGFVRDSIFYNDPELSPYSFSFTVAPDMDSEQAWSLEGRYQWNFLEGLKFKSDLYYMWYDNLIGVQDEYGITNSGLPSFEYVVNNTGGAKGYGLELELDYESGPLVWRIWYAYNDFETEFEHQCIRSFLPATNKLGLSLRWTIDERWIFNGQYAYSDLVDRDIDDYSIDSSNHLDLTITRRFLGSGELMIGVRDLFVREYDPVINGDQTRGYPIPGRTFFCRMQYTF